MKVVIDQGIKHVASVLSQKGFQVHELSEEKITNQVLQDCQVLFIRTRTTCDENLLKGTQVKFIATATVGTDHIDLDYCQKNQITVVSAAGCNKWSVVQYVLYSILIYAKKLNLKKETITLGIIGYGNIGATLYNFVNQLGINCIVYDPYKQHPTDKGLDYLLQHSTIVSVHTPLTLGGKHPTTGMINKEKLALLAQNSLLINSARGGIVDEKDLVELLSQNKIFAVTDCWEKEPNIATALLNSSLISTPHIAGYTIEGKLNASKFTLMKFFDYLGEANSFVDEYFTSLEPDKLNTQEHLYSQIEGLKLLSERLKKEKTKFVYLRNSYHFRPDFSTKKLNNYIGKLI